MATNVYASAKKAMNAFSKSPFTYINLVNKEKETFNELLKQLGVDELTISDFYVAESCDQRPLFCKLMSIKDESAVVEHDRMFNVRNYGGKMYRVVPIVKKQFDVNGKTVEAFSTGDFVECLKAMAIARADHAAKEKDMNDIFLHGRTIESYMNDVRCKYGDLPESVLMQIARVDMDNDSPINLKAAKVKAVRRSKAKAA